METSRTAEATAGPRISSICLSVKPVSSQIPASSAAITASDSICCWARTRATATAWASRLELRAFALHARLWYAISTASRMRDIWASPK